jgi:hypothetical protein
MSAQVLNHAKNKLSVDIANPYLELVSLAPERQEALQRFLLDIKAAGRMSSFPSIRRILIS